MHTIVLSALLFSFSIKIMPGPNNFLLLNSGLNFGIRKSLRLYLGICLGLPLLVLIVALGLGKFFLDHPFFDLLLKGVGASYLFYLAYQIANSYPRDKAKTLPQSMGFFKAIAFQWVNPKAWVMAIGAASLFCLSDNLYVNAAGLSAIFLFMCIPCLGFWLCGGAYLQKILKHETHRRYFNIFMAICLAGSALMILLK